MPSIPSKILDKIKYYFWKYLIYPIFPHLRNTLFLKLRSAFHNYRQPWHIGFLIPNKDVEDLKNFLFEKGFLLNEIAWIDPGEILSMRLFDGHEFQYHIRLFNDMEIRAHYEQTPEIHPFGHFFETLFEPRASKFKEILGDWCEYK